MFTRLQIAVNAHSKNSCVVYICKEFKPTHLSLECQNQLESPYKRSEAAKFSLTIPPFKDYKLLRRMPFRTTNEPLNILRTPSPRVPLRPYACKAPIKITFFFNWGKYLTSFNSLTISSDNLMRTVHIPSICHVWSSPNDIKPPSSFSKLANQFLSGQACHIEGIGIVRIKTFDETVRELHDVM